MAKYNEQIVRAWEEWAQTTGDTSGNPNDFLDWAFANGRLAPSPEDMRKLMRRRVTDALRQVQRYDGQGLPYRGKQCVMEFDSGQMVAHWFDTDSGGTPGLRAKAIKQRRDGIANDVYRAKRDCDHMNNVHNEKNQFVMDFTDDCLEREALDRLTSDDEAA